MWAQRLSRLLLMFYRLCRLVRLTPATSSLYIYATVSQRYMASSLRFRCFPLRLGRTSCVPKHSLRYPPQELYASVCGHTHHMVCLMTWADSKVLATSWVVPSRLCFVSVLAGPLQVHKNWQQCGRPNTGCLHRQDESPTRIHHQGTTLWEAPCPQCKMRGSDMREGGDVGDVGLPAMGSRGPDRLASPATDPVLDELFSDESPSLIVVSPPRATAKAKAAAQVYPEDVYEPVLQGDSLEGVDVGGPPVAKSKSKARSRAKPAATSDSAVAVEEPPEAKATSKARSKAKGAPAAKAIDGPTVPKTKGIAKANVAAVDGPSAATAKSAAKAKAAAADGPTVAKSKGIAKAKAAAVAGPPEAKASGKAKGKAAAVAGPPEAKASGKANAKAAAVAGPPETEARGKAKATAVAVSGGPDGGDDDNEPGEEDHEEGDDHDDAPMGEGADFVATIDTPERVYCSTCKQFVHYRRCRLISKKASIQEKHIRGCNVPTCPSGPGGSALYGLCDCIRDVLRLMQAPGDAGTAARSAHSCGGSINRGRLQSLRAWQGTHRHRTAMRQFTERPVSDLIASFQRLGRLLTLRFARLVCFLIATLVARSFCRFVALQWWVCIGCPNCFLQAGGYDVCG